MGYIPTQSIPFSIFDPTISVFLEKSRNGAVARTKVGGIEREIGALIFHPFYRVPYFTRIDLF